VSKKWRLTTKRGQSPRRKTLWLTTKRKLGSGYRLEKGIILGGTKRKMLKKTR